MTIAQRLLQIIVIRVTEIVQIRSASRDWFSATVHFFIPLEQTERGDG